MMRTLFLFLIGLFLSTQHLNACDCKSLPVSEKAIESFDFIFLGKVIAISGCDKTAKVTFAVDELYKGKSFANTELEFDCSSDCEMSFSPGQTWLIYATYKKYGVPEVNFCSLSRQQFANEKEDYNTALHTMTFGEEEAWLKKTLGVLELSVKDPQTEQHHENILPKGFQALWYLGFGFLGLVLIYFVGRKYIK